jgi:hypothetical protein
MLKKMITTVIALVLISTTGIFSTSAIADTKLPDPVKGQIMIVVIVNGEKVLFPDTEPFIDANNRTMVPVRFVSQKLGGEVAWDAVSKIVTITYKSKIITMPIDSKEVDIDGKIISLDTSAVLTDGRTMVPLRFVSEAMDTEVTWDGDAQSVKVNDAAFNAKVKSGEIKLDPWGRALAPAPAPATAAYWNVLSDIPSYVYDLPYYETDGDYSNKRLFAEEWKTLTSSDLAVEANKIKNYYLAALNVDFRTIDENAFAAAIIKEMAFQNEDSSHSEAGAKNYAKFVKKNHIIVKGYADPEMYLTRMEFGYVKVRTHFKFQVINSDNLTEAIADSYDPSKSSQTFKVNLGKWYDGYADVAFYQAVQNGRDVSGLAYNENMFVIGSFKYHEQ